MAETIGRPSVMTPQVLEKLEYAFSIGCTDAEASFYAGIHASTLYNYCKDNPDFIDRKEGLKDKPVLLARATVFESLNEAENAKWYLERKRKGEFAARQELSGANGKDLPQPILNVISQNISNAEDNKLIQANTSSTGGIISLEDNLDTPLLNS